MSLRFQPLRLRQARQARGFTLTALAEAGRVSSSAITEYERGERIPTANVLDRLALGLDVNRNLLSRVMPAQPTSCLFHRSMKQQVQELAEARYHWFVETLDFCARGGTFPPLNLPDLDIPGQLGD